MSNTVALQVVVEASATVTRAPGNEHLDEEDNDKEQDR